MHCSKSVFCVLTLCVSMSFGFNKIGWEFNSGSTSDIGCNLKLSPFIEIKPAFNFVSAADGHGLSPKVAVNWYLKKMQDLQNYIGIGASIYSLLPAYEKNVMLNIHYGLRYDLNKILSTFGEFGVQTNFHPKVQSFSTGIGLTFYVPRKDSLTIN